MSLPCVPRSRPLRASHIPALTLYSFSAENWKRPKGEVQFLMNLLRRYLKMELPTLMENNIRLQYIGRQQELPQEVQERMSWAREMTERNTGMVLTLALNYGSRTELVDCFNALVNEASRNGGIEHLKIDERSIARHLYTNGLPELDLVIRTSGEMRLSQLPAVAGSLRRDLRHRDAVARLPRHPTAGSHRSLSEARAPLRRAGRRQRKLFVKRVLTAVILIPIVVLALFRAPLWLFTLLVLGVALLAAKEYLGHHEGARLSAHVDNQLPSPDFIVCDFLFGHLAVHELAHRPDPRSCLCFPCLLSAHR